MKTTAQEKSDAERNAESWLSGIVEVIKKLGELESGSGPVEYDGKRFDDADALRERIYQEPLSVETRSGWTPNDMKYEAAEYMVLLSTGGPALRITGELERGNVPDDFPRLEFQDWGTPWTEYRTTTEEMDALASYARQFYFGE